MFYEKIEFILEAVHSTGQNCKFYRSIFGFCEDVDHGGPHPILSPCIENHLVVVHGLDSVVKGHDTPRNRCVSKHTALIPRKNEIVIPFLAKEKR